MVTWYGAVSEVVALLANAALVLEAQALSEGALYETVHIASAATNPGSSVPCIAHSVPKVWSGRLT